MTKNESLSFGPDKADLAVAANPNHFSDYGTKAALASAPIFSRELKKLALTVPEALQVLGIGRTRFYVEVRAGRIPVRKIGRRSILLTEDAIAYLRSLPTVADNQP